MSSHFTFWKWDFRCICDIWSELQIVRNKVWVQMSSVWILRACHEWHEKCLLMKKWNHSQNDCQVGHDPNSYSFNRRQISELIVCHLTNASIPLSFFLEKYLFLQISIGLEQFIKNFKHLWGFRGILVNKCLTNCRNLFNCFYGLDKRLADNQDRICRLPILPGCMYPNLSNLLQLAA